MELFLIIVAVFVLASWLERAELDHLKKDYEEWKRRR